jgi:hypothetical protein
VRLYTCFLCHISNALYCGVILWPSRVMQKPADKHGEKVSIYNWVPAELPWVACNWLYYSSAGRRTHVLFLRCHSDETAKTRSRETLPKCWLVSPLPAEGCCQYFNFIRASIIANYFHWRERTRALQTRYFISQGVHGIFLALSAKRVKHDWKLTLPNWFCVTWQRKIQGCDCDI